MVLGRNPRWTLVRAALLAVVCVFLFGFLARPVRVQGISMEPTLQNGSIHVINLLVYRYSRPARGDVVAVRMPGGGAYYMKRILGMPGETISFLNGTLIIDGVELPEDYIHAQGNWEMSPVMIPDAQYFIAGDNRRTTFNGHTLGLVNEKDLAGVLVR